jgi:hypothetical protein
MLKYRPLTDMDARLSSRSSRVRAGGKRLCTALYKVDNQNE